MRHFISNVICAFIPNKKVRDKVRVIIRYPWTFDCVRYVRNYARNMSKCHIKTAVGYGCRNFVVILNDKYVFKFPLMNDGIDVSLREKRITDALRSISPVKIPETKLIKFRGIMIRRYEFAHGKLLTDIKPAIISEHRKHIAKQLAEFLYVIGKSDPTEIRDLKPSPNEKPGYLYGWTQDDIWQNFMLDEKTMNLTFLIDWENAKFGDFTQSLRISSHNWDKFGYRGIIVDLLAEYSKMYFGAGKNKTVK